MHLQISTTFYFPTSNVAMFPPSSWSKVSLPWATHPFRIIYTSSLRLSVQMKIKIYSNIKQDYQQEQQTFTKLTKIVTALNTFVVDLSKLANSTWYSGPFLIISFTPSSREKNSKDLLMAWVESYCSFPLLLLPDHSMYELVTTCWTRWGWMPWLTR